MKEHLKPPVLKMLLSLEFFTHFASLPHLYISSVVLNPSLHISLRLMETAFKQNVFAWLIATFSCLLLFLSKAQCKLDNWGHPKKWRY